MEKNEEIVDELIKWNNKTDGFYDTKNWRQDTDRLGVKMSIVNETIVEHSNGK